jgi:hypothetical protein
MKLKVPESLTVEHQELHAELAEAARAGGAVGAAAQAVAKVLHAHLAREEQIALPPLALLRPLAEGDWRPEMAEVLALTDALRRELPRMHEEHRTFVGALKALSAVAGQHDHAEYAWLAEQLILHARTEEDVLYPAALLVGDYVRLKRRASET